MILQFQVQDPLAGLDQLRTGQDAALGAGFGQLGFRLQGTPAPGGQLLAHGLEQVAQVLEGARVRTFLEKPEGDGRWISGGFFVCEPAVLGRIAGDDTIWERQPLEQLASEGQLAVYKHTGFWAAMDTLRDKVFLERLWTERRAPWKVWE